MKINEGSSVEGHIKTMKELMDRLAAINAPISEENQIATLLGSLFHPGDSSGGQRWHYLELYLASSYWRGAEAERLNCTLMGSARGMMA